MADFVLTNEGTIEELLEQTEAFLDKLRFVYRRPSWDDYFMELMRVVAKRATCDRGRSGCVIVREKHILTTGYVGSAPGQPHCDEVGHQMKKTVHEDGSESWHCVRTVHAEQNAIIQAAKLGISLEGTTLYCKMTPCRVCAMLIIGVGIKRVVCDRKYHAGKESEDYFSAAKVKLEYVTEQLQKYKKQ
ncbi:MAG: dCMP deaminase family protein [Candidatus Micrarchaeota archaeon]